MAYVTEATKQQTREHRERVTIAYLQAMWMRIDNEKIPKIEELLGDDPDAVDPEVIKTREQSPDEMADILQTLSARSKGRPSTPRASRASRSIRK